METNCLLFATAAVDRYPGPSYAFLAKLADDDEAVAREIYREYFAPLNWRTAMAERRAEYMAEGF